MTILSAHSFAGQQLSFCTGLPRIDSNTLKVNAAEQGELNAWFKAFRNHEIKASNSIQGDFSIAISEPNGYGC